jgi:hypothetical protein
MYTNLYDEHIERGNELLYEMKQKKEHKGIPVTGCNRPWRLMGL